MTTVIYGGTKHQVLEQLECDHDWDAPYIDLISRYIKCKKCFAIDRDCTESQYYQRLSETKE